MKALAIHERGGPASLRLVDIDLPEPGPGEVVIGIRACAVNQIDVDLIRGTLELPVDIPFVPGIEVVGTITKIGADVAGWEIGERVARQVQDARVCCPPCRTARHAAGERGGRIGPATSGGYAEELVCRADRLIRVPESLTDEAAAATQVAFGTAWHMLVARGRLRAGETVLVNDVDSGIGAAAVQVATWAGARVIGTAGSDDALHRAGTDRLAAAVNYAANPAFGPEVRHRSGGGVDLAIEYAGEPVFTASLNSLANGGRLVTCGPDPGEPVDFDIVAHFRGQHEVLGSCGFTKPEVAAVFDLAARGAVEPAVDSVFSLVQGARAVARFESTSARGKVVMMP